MKKAAKSLLLIFLFIAGYLLALRWDIKRVDQFCAEMRPGLDVRKVAEIANRHSVGFKYVRDPGSVDTQKLGIKLTDKENTWFFAVAAPMTVGEHACDVYHDNKVILSAKASW